MVFHRRYIAQKRCINPNKYTETKDVSHAKHRANTEHRHRRAALPEP